MNSRRFGILLFAIILTLLLGFQAYASDLKKSGSVELEGTPWQISGSGCNLLDIIDQLGLYVERNILLDNSIVYKIYSTKSATSDFKITLSNCSFAKIEKNVVRSPWWSEPHTFYELVFVHNWIDWKMALEVKSENINEKVDGVYSLRHRVPVGEIFPITEAKVVFRSNNAGYPLLSDEKEFEKALGLKNPLISLYGKVTFQIVDWFTAALTEIYKPGSSLVIFLNPEEFSVRDGGEF